MIKTEGENMEKAQSTDVGDLYQILNDNPSRDAIERVKAIAIGLGHSGVFERCYQLLDEEPSKQELHEALYNALGVRGYSAHDEKTAVGYFYQRLYDDFDSVSLTMAGKQVPFKQVDMYIDAMLDEKGVPVSERGEVYHQIKSQKVSISIKLLELRGYVKLRRDAA